MEIEKKTAEEQKMYILPDEGAVEELLSRLRDGGVSDRIQVNLSDQSKGGEGGKRGDTLLDDMSVRLQALMDTTPTNSVAHSMGGIEKLLDDKYLATDGEQKVYVLPNDVDVEQLLGGLAGGGTGESKQSQMWRKTDININSQGQDGIIGKMTTHFQAIDKRLDRLELLLKQIGIQDDREKK